MNINILKSFVESASSPSIIERDFGPAATGNITAAPEQAVLKKSIFRASEQKREI